MAAQVTEQFSFTSDTCKLNNRYDLSKSWTLVVDCYVSGVDTNGDKTIIAGITNNRLGLYTNDNGKQTQLNVGSWGQQIDTANTAWTVDLPLSGPVQLTIQYNEDGRVQYSFANTNGYPVPSSGSFTLSTLFTTDDILSGFSTGISDYDVNSVGPGGQLWKRPSGSFTGTVAVPEPTTATLSLLALAGLAARRRRK